MLGAEVSRKYGAAGLPAGTIDIALSGSAGQSLAAFLPKGVKITLSGDSNDYVGKGLSGGTVVVKPDAAATFASEENVIAGNVIGYGATSGEIYIRGIVGERFCVRNSGAIAVVEGIGDHGLEYMTGGKVVILGKTGRNLAAGMSGGVAYVLDLDQSQVNGELVDLLPLGDGEAAVLREILVDFARESDSKVAKDLLANWSSSITRFTMVLPRDYARIMKVIEAATAAGIDVDKAVMEAI
jgi:glutamate synthase (NADPH/NADH) large chain